MEKSDPLIMEHLGDVYLKLNDKDAAIRAWKKSLEFEETEEGLRERIEIKIKETLR